MKRYRLLIVSPKLVAGGEERDIVDLIKKLDRQSFALTLCLFDASGEFTKEIPEDVDIYTLTKKSRWSAPTLVLKLSRLIDSVRPDIIVSSLMYSTALVSLASFLSKHSFAFIAREPHNHKQDFPGLNFRDFVSRAMMDYGHKKPAAVIAVSRGAAEDIARNYGIPAERMRYIYSSVDIEKIKNSSSIAAEELLEGKKRVITLGRLVKRKGLETLLRSFKIVLESHDAELMIIGNGSERSSLESLANELGVKNSIKFLGFVENPYSLIASSDVFVFSSLWEGFGKVLIEAFACGTPVVSTRCPYGPEEIITDGVNGLLVPVGDDQAMAGAVIRILNDPELAARLSDSGRQRANDFSVEKNVKAHEKLFAELAGSR